MAEIKFMDSIAVASIDKVDTYAKSSISNINSYTFPLASVDIGIEYTFNSQTTQETAGQNWVPSGDAENWVNGADAVDGTFWGQPEDTNDVVKGFNCGFGGTSSGGTGPNGGVKTSDGGHNTSERYLYTEASSNNSLKCAVARMPGSAFSTEMTSTINDLNLKFWVHAYGTAGTLPNLYVYIDTNASSNHGTATLLQTYLGTDLDDDYTGNSSVWVQKTISLNAYRIVVGNPVHFIYFVAQGGSGFRSDFAIDSVIIEES
jgi:hypothetical protein